MSSVGKANIIIDAQNNASAELQKVQKDIKRISGEVNKTSKSMSQRAENNKATFQSMAIGGGVALAGITALAKKSVMAFSDYEESINAVNVMFGESSKAVQAFAQTSAKEIGLSKTEFQSMAVPIGAMLKNAGAGTEELSEKTIELAKRAADMASVFNTSVPDAMSALQQALRGEAEAIRRYGGDVTDATLQTYLLSQGIKQKVTDLSQGEKTMYRYDLMMQQTAVTTGDFKNTADGLANSLRIQEAQAKDASISLGQGLKPALDAVRSAIEPVLQNVFKWIQANPELSANIIIAIGAISGLVAILGTLGLVIPSIIAGFTAIKFAIIAISGPVGILISLLTGLAVYIYKNWGEIKTFWVGVGQSIKSSTTEAWNSVYGTIKGIIDSVIKYVTDKFARVTAIMQGVKNLGSNIISGVSNTLGIQARAKGGPVNGGQPYLVGEKGPELFVPGNSGKIIPNNKMGGGNSININLGGVAINNGRDENRLVQTIETTITKAIRGQSLGYV